MRYFTYIADQSFKTAANGERLFFQWGPWFRPYILPDAATQDRIHRKLVWLLRTTIIGIALMIALLRLGTFVQQPLYFFCIVALATAGFVLAQKLVLASDLRGLERADRPMSLSGYYGEMARKHSFVGLGLGFAGGLAFVVLGLALAILGPAGWPGFFCAAFFAVASLGWGYAIWLKLRQTSG